MDRGLPPPFGMGVAAASPLPQRPLSEGPPSSSGTEPTAPSMSPRSGGGSADKGGRSGADKIPVEGTVITEDPPGNIVVKEGHAELKKKEFLSDMRIQRLEDMDIKAVEDITFDDIRNYNRDQLRAYCFVYGVPRRKKVEMERDMARYASYFNKGNPAFDPEKYTPMNALERKLLSSPEPPAVSSPEPPSRLPVDSTAKQSSPPPRSSDRESAVGTKRPPPASKLPPPTFKQPPPIPTHQQVANEQKRRLSEKQRRTWERENEHLKQTAEKFKAAFNGASPLTANMVENAAAYFEGKSTPEAIEDQALSWERYHRNVGLLKELFEGTEPLAKRTPAEDVDMTVVGRLIDLPQEKFTLEEVETACATQLDKLAKRYKQIDEAEETRDRIYIKAFQRLEKATTLEAVQEARAEFESTHDLKIVEMPPRMVQREVPSVDATDKVEYEDFPGLKLMSF